MKNFNGRNASLTLALSVLLATPFVTGCKESPKEKLDDATTEVVDASIDLEKAHDAYLAEVESYKADAAKKIAENEEKIKAYNSDMNLQKTKALKTTVEKLQKKIDDLKQKIANLKADDGKETWSEFKTEFDHDMEEIGQALKDITVNNTKK